MSMNGNSTESEITYVVVGDIVEERYVSFLIEKAAGNVEEFRRLYNEYFFRSPRIVNEEGRKRCENAVKEQIMNGRETFLEIFQISSISVAN